MNLAQEFKAALQQQQPTSPQQQQPLQHTMQPAQNEQQALRANVSLQLCNIADIEVQGLMAQEVCPGFRG